jgi:hypothetical protein
LEGIENNVGKPALFGADLDVKAGECVGKVTIDTIHP